MLNSTAKGKMKMVATVLGVNIVLLAIFSALPSVSKAFSQGSFGDVDFENFEVDKFSYLNITKLNGSELVEYGGECGFACLEIPSCISYNLAAFPDINGQSLCELLPSDKYNNSDKFTPNKVFHHFSIPSPCSSGPCKNNGSCVTLYHKEKSYVCVCKEGFTGKNCETIIDECGSNPCVNNGTCIGGVNGFTCNCTRDFGGDRCEIDLSINSINLTAFFAPTVGNDSKWLLCYRASIHGWAASTFHSRCDGKRHTITIIRKGPYVFGGYTDIPWDGSSGYGSTSNAFIFSLRNKEGLAPFKSMVVKPQYAIGRLSSYGPIFGYGHDILIYDNANTNQNSYTDFGEYGSYTVPSGVKDQNTLLAGTRHFSPDDWEVFYRK